MQVPAITSAAVGRRVAIVGDVYRYLATGEETGGKYALIEATVPPGGGPPLHVHSRETEGFYILDGEMTFHVAEGDALKTVVATVGTSITLPPGVKHAFRNATDREARMLILVAPAGLEKMFLEVGVELTDSATAPPPKSKTEIERLLAAAPRYGIEIFLPE
jgi:quercetin dioxygenase-like cupin family protein